MVFETANVPFRYLTPESPEPEITVAQPVKQQSPSADHQRMQPNGYVATPPTSQQRTLHAVVVEDNITPAQRAQYKYVPEFDQSSGGQNMSTSRGVSITQQQKGNQAVQALQNLLLEIFQAQDQLEPDTSGAVSLYATNYFDLSETDDSNSKLLLPIQSKLDSSIHKAAVHGRLGDMQVGDLSRVQHLCEHPVVALSSLSLLIGDDWTEDDITEWLVQLRTGEAGLTAARTLLHIMTSLTHTKELQSEDIVRNILDGLRAVVEGFLIPIVQEPAFTRERVRGEKGEPPKNPRFVIASDHRREIVALLNAATKTLRLLGDLLVKTVMDDTDLSTVQYLCKMLIFAENATIERESAIGIQNFESLRRCAMDVLAKMFTKYPDLRQDIFNEILISLEKLPATKQNARQYRLPGSKPIQLVSALLMRLVQTSATRSSEALRLRTKVQSEEDADEDGASSTEESQYDDDDEIKVAPNKKTANSNDLLSITKPLHDAAFSNARYIVQVLISRALSISKSSDEPYRKLLDIFVEDFVSCLGSPDWPAAELLLRALLLQMIAIVEKESSAGASRTLALEFLGTMGSGILELQINARSAAEAVDPNDTLAGPLREMVKQLERNSLDIRDVLAFDGPYRKVIEYVNARNTNDDAQLTTARGFYLTQWAVATFNRREGSTESDTSDTPRTPKDLQAKLKQMLTDPHWFDEQGGLDNLTTAVGNLAAMVITLNSTFCRASTTIFRILFGVMNSTTATSTVKSRSMKSIVTLLEKDKTLLDRNSYILSQILRCAGDASPLVRNEALNLIDKCISLQPSLSAKLSKTIILRTQDGSNAVRKHALKMLKDVYLRNDSIAIRSAIANAIIARIQDTEESVIELARTTMEEIWFQPLYPVKIDGDKAVQGRLAYATHAALLIETTERSDDMHTILQALLKRMLSKSKASGLNTNVCQTLITILFDGVVNSHDIPGTPPRAAILRTLTIFAIACPNLFTASQLQRLDPYIQIPKTIEELDDFKPSVIILRHALPHLPIINKSFLEKIGITILQGTTKLEQSDMNEAVPCLWTISCILDDKSRIANFVISVLRNLTAKQDEKRLIRFMTMAGEYGNACDLEAFLPRFKEEKALQSCTANSVADLIVELTCPYTQSHYSPRIRQQALDSVCSICQAWPKAFTRTDVEQLFTNVFESRTPELEEVLVNRLQAFFVSIGVSDPDDEGTKTSEPTTGSERFVGTYQPTYRDTASLAIAQRFVTEFLRIAISSNNEAAFTAARLVISINKQGLVNPQTSAPVLVALETCEDKAVAAAAFQEHKDQHAKHESIYDQAYMRAVEQTFQYQARVIGKPSGIEGNPPTAKMHPTWDVLKVAKVAVRKKFLANIASKMDFDFASANVNGQQTHLAFVRFCVENLALFEYDKVDDVLHLLEKMEKVFHATGSNVAQAIESDVLKLQVGDFDGTGSVPNGDPDAIQLGAAPGIDIEPARLQQLAVAAQILMLMWETRSTLIRVWNMQRHMAKANKKQGKDKDQQKAPNRSTNAGTYIETYLKRVADICAPLSSEEACKATCSTFAEIISVDNEVKIASDEDADDTELLNGYDTPSEGGSKKSPSLPPSGGPRGKKRKLSMSAGATPKKRGRPPGSGRRRSGSIKYADQDDEDGGWD
jgi:cohesin loading factor subunit SCC2